MRPVHLFKDLKKLAEETAVTKERFGSVARVFIMCDLDNKMPLDLQQLMIKTNPPDEVAEIKGSDHMIMMSRSVQLFSCLLKAANQY